MSVIDNRRTVLFDNMINHRQISLAYLADHSEQKGLHYITSLLPFYHFYHFNLLNMLKKFTGHLTVHLVYFNFRICNVLYITLYINFRVRFADFACSHA